MSKKGPSWPTAPGFSGEQPGLSGKEEALARSLIETEYDLRLRREATPALRPPDNLRALRNVWRRPQGSLFQSGVVETGESTPVYNGGQGRGATPARQPSGQQTSGFADLERLQEKIRGLQFSDHEAFENAVLRLVRADPWRNAYELSPHSMPAVAEYANNAYMREVLKHPQLADLSSHGPSLPDGNAIYEATPTRVAVRAVASIIRADAEQFAALRERLPGLTPPQNFVLNPAREVSLPVRPAASQATGLPLSRPMSPLSDEGRRALSSSSDSGRTASTSQRRLTVAARQLGA